MASAEVTNGSDGPKGILGKIEVLGNKLPDPAVLFVLALAGTWIVSAILSAMEVSYEVPSAAGLETRFIQNQLSFAAIVQFMADMVHTFTSFHPLGVVLVALLGVGVAEHSGFINAGLKAMLSFTPGILLTPMLILVAIVSHTAADAGYVLVIPLGGVIFYAAGRHPLAGIAAAFAGVSGGFSANFLISGIDPLLQGITQTGVDVLNPDRQVNPLCNWGFTAASSALIVSVGWFITARIIEPRLKNTEVDGDPDEMPKMEELEAADKKGLMWGLITLGISVFILIAVVIPSDSAFRDPAKSGMDSITSFAAPIMQSIVPLIFLLFLLPGIVHGYVSGRYKSHRDVIQGMSKSMGTMSYYLVMAFCASLFIYSFGKSNLGAFLAVEGANILKALALPGAVTIVGIILLCAGVNLLVGSASAKWALLAPILVPMLMEVGISPELTQAAYRVGDSSTNIITPLMPYFPLVVAFGQRYVRGCGIGTLISIMLPYSILFLATWTLFLLAFWGLGIPLGIQGGYTYTPPGG